MPKNTKGGHMNHRDKDVRHSEEIAPNSDEKRPQSFWRSRGGIALLAALSMPSANRSFLKLATKLSASVTKASASSLARNFR